MWQQPKINWAAEDSVGCDDYNRIKGNLIFLRDFASTLYTDFELEEMGEDKGEEDYPYADEFNLIEENLHAIINSTWGADYGESTKFYENGAFIDFNELNRIESATLDLYNQLTNQYEGRRMLTFMLGKREVL